MEKLHRMVSIDLNTPTASLSGVYQTKPGANRLSSLEENKKFRLLNSKFLSNNNEPTIYDKYFHKHIAKIVSIAQLFFAAIVLISQLTTTGLLIGPAVLTSPGTALSVSDRIGLGIWASIGTTLAVGATFWAINKTNFCRLHTAMLLHGLSLMAYLILEYLVLISTVPNIQERIYFLQENMAPVSTVDARRQLLNSRKSNEQSGGTVWLEGDITKTQEQMQAELHRLYAALVLSIVMALTGILQLITHFFVTLKTARAVCLGKTYYEDRQLRIQTIGSNWRGKPFRLDSKDSTLELPKLERSDALPPPPYESGYFHPSLSA